MLTTLYANRDLGALGRLTRRPVVQVMRTPAPTVYALMPMHTALATMVRLGVRHLVVVDDRDRCVGVMSDRTVAAGWASSHIDLLRQTVAEALDPDPAVIPSRAVIRDAARRMCATGVDALAVADPQCHPVGIITSTDLVALLADDLNHSERE